MKLSPATIIAGAAIFLALGSGTYAGAQALITSSQIANRTIRLVDLHPSTIKALRGQRGLRGPSGPLGPAGPAGGFSPEKLTYVIGPEVSVAPGQVASATADCPAGSVVIAGGSSWSLGNAAATVFNNNTKTAWVTIVYNDKPLSVPIQSFAICSTR